MTYGASLLSRSKVFTSYPALIKLASADIYLFYHLVVYDILIVINSVGIDDRSIFNSLLHLDLGHPSSVVGSKFRCDWIIG